MKFVTFAIADVSTAHLSSKDAELMADPAVPGRLAALDELDLGAGAPGFVFSVGTEADHNDRLDDYRARGFSEEFIALVGELAAQQIPYVRFDRDGGDVDGAPVFDW